MGKVEDVWRGHMSESIDNLRRIAERGLRAAQRLGNSEMIDLWTHILDEIKRF